MKTAILTFTFLAAASLLACGASASDPAPPEGTAPSAEATPKKVELERSPDAFQAAGVVKPEFYQSCTPAEFAACQRRDPYGSGCIIENGRVVCLFE